MQRQNMGNMMVLFVMNVITGNIIALPKTLMTNYLKLEFKFLNIFFKLKNIEDLKK